MKNAYNEHLINIVENPKYYEKELLDFILKKTSASDLNEINLGMGRINNISFMGNFTSLINKTKSYCIEERTKIVNHIEDFKINGLSEALYKFNICHKEFVVGQNCYNEFKKINIKEFDYEKNKQLKKEEKESYILFLLYSEHVIDYKLLDEKNLDNLYKIILENKEFINKLNNKKDNVINLFVENEAMRNLISVLSLEKKKNIIENLDVNKVISLYFKKLYKNGKYGIENYLDLFEKSEVIKCLQEIDFKRNWIDILLEKATGNKVNRIDNLINTGFSSIDKTKMSVKAMRELIYLYDYFKEDITITDQQINRIICGLTIMGKKDLYFELRTKISPILNDDMVNYMNSGKIGPNKISDIEKEFLSKELGRELKEGVIVKKNKI